LRLSTPPTEEEIKLKINFSKLTIFLPFLINHNPPYLSSCLPLTLLFSLGDAGDGNRFGVSAVCALKLSWGTISIL
jgi:hypothetical protein